MRVPDCCWTSMFQLVSVMIEAKRQLPGWLLRCPQLYVILIISYTIVCISKCSVLFVSKMFCLHLQLNKKRVSTLVMAVLCIQCTDMFSLNHIWAFVMHLWKLKHLKFSKLFINADVFIFRTTIFYHWYLNSGDGGIEPVP